MGIKVIELAVDRDERLEQFGALRLCPNPVQGCGNYHDPETGEPVQLIRTKALFLSEHPEAHE